MNLSELIQGIDDITLRAHVRNQNYPEIAQWLNEPTQISNPAPQGQVPVTPDPEELLALLSTDELRNIISHESALVWLTEILSNPLYPDKSAAVELLAAMTSGVLNGDEPLGNVASDAFLSGDADIVAAFLGAVQAYDVISADSASAMVQYMSRTKLDPSYQVTVDGPSRAEALGYYGSIDARRVQGALN